MGLRSYIKGSGCGLNLPCASRFTLGSQMIWLTGSCVEIATGCLGRKTSSTECCDYHILAAYVDAIDLWHASRFNVNSMRLNCTKAQRQKRSRYD